MFSSTNNMNPFAHFSSSSHLSLPTPLISHPDSGDIFLHHHHDQLPGALAPINPQKTEFLINLPLLNNPTMTKKVEVIDCQNGGSGFHPLKKPVRKDRHRKICTAQGVRHRRVRLSIRIAREFFDLQDMLGFDKASKTLGWLLTKSRSAIKETVKMKSINGTMPSSTFEYKFEMVPKDGDLGLTVSKGKALEGVSKEKDEMKMLQKAAIIHLPAKESTTGESTREKMCTRRIDDLKKFPGTIPQILNQFQKSEIVHNILPKEVEELVTHQTPREEVIFQESAVRKRKMVDYQQNTYFPDFPQNWDISGAIPHRTVSTVTNLNL